MASYDWPLLRFRRRAKGIFERSNKRWLRCRHHARHGGDHRRRRGRARRRARCNRNVLTSRDVNTVRGRRRFVSQSHMIDAIQSRRNDVRRCQSVRHVRRHRATARQRARRRWCTSYTAGTLLMRLLGWWLLLRLLLGLVLLLWLLLVVDGSRNCSCRTAHYRGCMLTRMNGTRRHRG